MELTFLGTGTSQGIPVIACDCEVCVSDNPQNTRLRTSAMVTIGGKNIVIDVGPDFRQQMLANKVLDIDSVLITHQHNDHVIGMDDVRPFNFRYRKDIPIYCSAGVIKDLKNRFAYAFATKPYPGAPQLDLREIKAGQNFIVADQEIIPFEVKHGGMPVLGFRFGALTYITDAKIIPPEAIEEIKGTEVLVLNALRQEEHHSHLTLQEALDFIDLIKPRQAFLTHLSHKMGTLESVNKLLPSHVTIAYDGLNVHIA